MKGNDFNKILCMLCEGSVQDSQVIWEKQDTMWNSMFQSKLSLIDLGRISQDLNCKLNKLLSSRLCKGKQDTVTNLSKTLSRFMDTIRT